jgi:hypothetical protein
VIQRTQTRVRRHFSRSRFVTGFIVGGPGYALIAGFSAALGVLIVIGIRHVI